MTCSWKHSANGRGHTSTLCRQNDSSLCFLFPHKLGLEYGFPKYLSVSHLLSRFLVRKGVISFSTLNIRMFNYYLIHGDDL